MKSAKTALPGASRVDSFLLAPENLHIVTDKSHPLYDPREALPVDEALVLNVMAHGVKVPILVRKDGERVEVVDGRQRVKAAVEANRRLAKEGKVQLRVKAVLERGDEADIFGVPCLTNELRRDDTPVAKARKAQRLLAMGKSEAEVAVVFGLSVSALRKLLQLLDLAPKVQAKVESGALSVTAASKLAKLPREEQVQALEKLGDEPVTAKKAAAQVAAAKGEEAKPTPPSKAQVRTLLARLGNADEVITAAAVLRWVLDGEVHPEIERLLSSQAA